MKYLIKFLILIKALLINIDATKAQVIKHDTIRILDIQDESINIVNEDSIIYTTLEVAPKFPGGLDSLNNYIKKYTYYPSNFGENKSGFVLVKFIIEKDGCVSHSRILSGMGDPFDREAIRVVNSLPQWKPGKRKNIPRRVFGTVQIKFCPSGCK